MTHDLHGNHYSAENLSEPPIYETTKGMIGEKTCHLYHYITGNRFREQAQLSKLLVDVPHFSENVCEKKKKT